MFQQLVENTNVRLIVADTDLNIVYMNPASERTLRSLERFLPCPVEEMIGKSIDLFHKQPERARGVLGNPDNLPHHAMVSLGTEIIEIKVLAIKDIAGNYVGPMVSWSVVTEQVAAQQREIELHAAQDEARELLEKKVNQLMRVVTAAADGDLTSRIEDCGDDDLGRLAAGMRKMMEDLRHVISQVIEAANQQTDGARTIAESSANLSDGARTQAASVENMTASVDDLTNAIQVISQSTAESRTQAEETTSMAKDGGEAVGEAINAMQLIQKSSNQINDIIQVISEIASQTNLLALNAAIEAARAGEHGLGFAVVADEVRKLAERSSEAAKEITQLIKESTRRVSQGAQRSEKAGQALAAIVKAVDKNAVGIAACTCRALAD